jgi:hypothetical protein
MVRSGPRRAVKRFGGGLRVDALVSGGKNGERIRGALVT